MSFIDDIITVRRVASPRYIPL